MVSEEQAEKAGQASRGNAETTEKRDRCQDGSREKKRGWFCSRFFLLAAFLCLFVNQAAGAPGLFSVLFSAGIQAGFLWAAGTWIRRGREKEKEKEKEKAQPRVRESILVVLGFAAMLCAQFLLLTQAGGYPEDQELWMRCWGGLPGLGKWIGEHWKAAEIAAAGCVDLSVLMAVRFAGKYAGMQARGQAHLFLLFLLIGISPWILVPQPLFFVMPVITGLMLYAGRRAEETDGEWEESRGGYLAGGAAVLLFLLCLSASGLNVAGIKDVFEGKSLPGLLLYWFESLKNGFSDGTFGWLSAPKLEPFTMNGWALRLQNTIYPGADRYGWYAGLVQGTWVLLLWMEAAVPVEKAAGETVFFLAAMLFLPLWQPTGSCMAVAVFLPWLVVRASLENSKSLKDRL